MSAGAPSASTRRATAIGLPLAMLAAALLAPGAAAHGAGFEAMRWVDDQPVDVWIDGAPLPAAATPLRLHVLAPPVEGLAPVSRVEARLLPPDGSDGLGWFALDGDGDGQFSSRIVFSEPGAWRVDLRIDGRPTVIDVRVYGASPFFVDAAPETVDRGAVIAGAQEVVLLRIHDAADAPAPVVHDAIAHVTSLDEAGQTVDAASFPLEHVGDGRYRFIGSWPPGTLQVRVESAAWRLEREARPPVSLLVTDGSELEVYRARAEKDSSAPRIGVAIGLGIAVLAVVALAAVASGRATRRR